MKAYTLDLRERVIQFVQAGGSKAEAARRFAVGRRTVCRYLAAATAGTLAPKTTWGTWRKLDPQKLQAHVRQQPDATLQEIATVFGVSHNAVWVRLGKLGLNLRNTPKKLQAHPRQQPHPTPQEVAAVFGISHNAVWVRLGKLGFTLKKTQKTPRAQRGATLALPARTRKIQRPARLLPRRMRRGSPPVS